MNVGHVHWWLFGAVKVARIQFDTLTIGLLIYFQPPNFSSIQSKSNEDPSFQSRIVQLEMSSSKALRLGDLRNVQLNYPTLNWILKVSMA